MFEELNVGRLLDLFWVNASGGDETRWERIMKERQGAGRLDASQISRCEEE